MGVIPYKKNITRKKICTGTLLPQDNQECQKMMMYNEMFWVYYDYKGLNFTSKETTVSENRKCEVLLKVKPRRKCEESTDWDER